MSRTARKAVGQRSGPGTSTDAVARTCADYDFDAQPGVDRKTVEDLATLRFLEDATNVMFIGPPGVGKTMLAVALGQAAIEAGYRTYYTTAADLAARCHKAAIEGRWGTVVRACAGPRLLIIDEVGYLPLPAESSCCVVSGCDPEIPQRVDCAHDEPRHSKLGQGIRRPHGRCSNARPALASISRFQHRRRELPHAAACPASPRGSTPRCEVGSTITGPSTAPSCTPWQCASTSISFDGPCRSSSDCGANQQRLGPGLMLSDSTGQDSLPTGICCRAPTVDLWGPDDGRLSRPVLREREGEIPSRYSPEPHARFDRGPLGKLTHPAGAAGPGPVR